MIDEDVICASANRASLTDYYLKDEADLTKELLRVIQLKSDHRNEIEREASALVSKATLFSSIKRLTV